MSFYRACPQVLFYQVLPFTRNQPLLSTPLPDPIRLRSNRVSGEDVTQVKRFDLIKEVGPDCSTEKRDCKFVEVGRVEEVLTKQ